MISPTQFLQSHGVGSWDADLTVETINTEYPRWRTLGQDRYIKKYTCNFVPFTIEYTHARNQVLVHLGKFQLLGQGKSSTVSKTIDFFARTIYAHKKPRKMAAHMPIEQEYAIYQQFAGYPNVVQVVQKTTRGILFEYMNEKDLETHGCSNCPNERPSILRQVALGVEQVHSRGFVHRDIRPSNFLCNRLPNGELAVKIADLELAVPEYSPDTRMQGFMLYCSPRLLQIRIAEYFERRNTYIPQKSDDLYALAITLFELETGAKPPISTTVNGIMTQLERFSIDSVFQLLRPLNQLRRQLCLLEYMPIASKVAQMAVGLMLGRFASAEAVRQHL